LADNGTFWHLSDWHDVTDAQSGFFAGMDELSGADTFWADHGFGDLSVLVWISKLDLGDWGASTWIVTDIFHETLDKPVSFGIIERSEFGGALSALASCGEDGSGTFTLALNNSSHINVSVSST
jgi:hypothetical protein